MKEGLNPVQKRIVDTNILNFLLGIDGFKCSNTNHKTLGYIHIEQDEIAEQLHLNQKETLEGILGIIEEKHPEIVSLLNILLPKKTHRYLPSANIQYDSESVNSDNLEIRKPPVGRIVLRTASYYENMKSPRSHWKLSEQLRLVTVPGDRDLMYFSANNFGLVVEENNSSGYPTIKLNVQSLHKPDKSFFQLNVTVDPCHPNYRQFIDAMLQGKPFNHLFWESIDNHQCRGDELNSLQIGLSSRINSSCLKNNLSARLTIPRKEQAHPLLNLATLELTSQNGRPPQEKILIPEELIRKTLFTHTLGY